MSFALLTRETVPSRERGAALVVVLVMLLCLTLLGLSFMRSTTLETRLTGNQEQTQMAQQAAENAIAAVIREANLGNKTDLAASGGTAAQIQPLLDRVAEHAAKNPTSTGAFTNFRRCLNADGTLAAFTPTAAETNPSCATAIGARNTIAWVTVEWQACGPLLGQRLTYGSKSTAIHFFKVTGEARLADGVTTATTEQYTRLTSPAFCPPALAQLSRRH